MLGFVESFITFTFLFIIVECISFSSCGIASIELVPRSIIT